MRWSYTLRTLDGRISSTKRQQFNNRIQTRIAYVGKTYGRIIFSLSRKTNDVYDLLYILVALCRINNSVSKGCGYSLHIDIYYNHYDFYILFSNNSCIRFGYYYIFINAIFILIEWVTFTPSNSEKSDARDMRPW